MTWALISVWQAAAEGVAALAYAEQLAMLSRVLELWDSVPDAADRLGVDHVRVLEEAVQVTLAIGDESRGVGLAAAAFAGTRRPGRAGPRRAAAGAPERAPSRP